MSESFAWFLDQHAVGDLVYGRVDHLDSGSAVVLVGDDVYGSVPASEVPDDAVLAEGDELWVKITGIDRSSETVTLSVRQASEGGPVAQAYSTLFPPDDEGPDTSGVSEPRNPRPGRGDEGAALDERP